VVGFVRGTWTIERKRGEATLRPAPSEPLPRAAEGELAEEGDSLLRFVEPDASGFVVEVGEPPGARNPGGSRRASEAPRDARFSGFRQEWVTRARLG
jgi:hypothetical protein